MDDNRGIEGERGGKDGIKEKEVTEETIKKERYMKKQK